LAVALGQARRVDVLRDACRLCGDQPIVVVLLSSQVMST